MSEKTLDELNKLVNNSDKLSTDDKNKLNAEIDSLKKHLIDLELTDSNLAKSIADKTHKNISAKVSSESQDEFVEDLVLNFEANHPKITNTLQNLVNLLTGIGI